MAKQLNVDLNLRANTQQAKSSLSDLQKTLNQIMNTNTITINDVSIEKAKQAAQELSQHLKNATNVNTGKLDLGKLSSSLQKSGQDLKSFQTQLSRIGPEGNQAFLQLAQSIAAADASAITLSSRMSGFLTTLKNTARWQISSSLLHGFMGAIQGAYGYAQDLNKSLNNIRIVTGQSTDQMAAFAREANNAAKALSTSTLNYTDAALIYYQQGIRDQKEIEQRTTTTIKLANVSRQSAEDVSSEMTAIWNNFAKGSKNLEYYADVITALGAATASSSQEIASGLQKFASVADTVGLSYEKASAALATIVAVTRQSEDVVGTALKTIFARVDSLKLGETLEDGVSLNKYAKALETVGVNILDSNQNLKDMDTILDELGNKWSNISEAQRVALAETVAGQRQYAQFMALMNNYDQVLANQQIAQMSEGTLQKQQEIYAESWEAARDRVKASLQTIYDQLLDDKAFINLTNGLSKTINFISSLIDNLGGLKSILLIIGTIVMNTYATRMPAILSKLKDNFMVITGQAEKVRQKMLASATEALNDPSLITNNRSAAQVAGIQAITEAKLKLAQETKNLTEQEILERKAQIELLETRVQNTTALGAELDKTEEEIAALERKARLQLGGRNTTVSTDLNTGDFENVKSQITSEYGRTLSSFKGVAQGSEEYKNLQTQLQNLKREASEVQSIITKISSGKMTNKQLVQEFSSAAKEVGKMHSALDAVEAKTKIWTKQLEQVKTGKISVADLKTEMTSFRDVLKDAGINTERIDKALDNLAADGAGLDALIDEFMQVGDLDIGSNLGIAEQKLEAFQTALHSLGVEDKVIEDLVTDIQNGENIAQKLQIALSNIKMPDQNIKKPIQFSEALGAVAGAAMQTAMAINALKNIGNIWNDEDLSAGEKLLQTFMSLGQIIPLVTLFTDQSRLANLSDAAAKILGIGATTASTAAEAASIPVKGASAAATWAMVWPILALVAALGAVVGAVAIFVTVIKKMQAAREADRKSAENATKAAEELQQAYENTKQAYEDLQSTISNYDSAKEALDTLTEGTREWRDKLREANEQARQLIETYPELAKYSHYTSQGLLEISQEGLDEALEKQSQKVSESMSSAILAKANAEILSARADVTDLKNSQHWRTQTSDILSGLGVIGGLLGGFAWPAGIAVGGFNIAANAHDSKIDKAIDKAVQAYAENAELVGKTDTQLAEMFDVTSDLIPKIRELGEATKQAKEDFVVMANEALITLYEGNKNINHAAATAAIAGGGKYSQEVYDKYYQQYKTDATSRGRNVFGIKTRANETSKGAFAEYAKIIQDENNYQQVTATNYLQNGGIEFTVITENGEKQKKTVTPEALASKVAGVKAAEQETEEGEKRAVVINTLSDETAEFLQLASSRIETDEKSRFNDEESLLRFLELKNNENVQAELKSLTEADWAALTAGENQLGDNFRTGKNVAKWAIENQFGYGVTEEILQPLLEVKEALNLTEASKKAVNALSEVKEALKEVMTQEDWDEIDTKLTQAGITDLSSEDLKGFTYEQQKNILDTAYRKNIEDMVAHIQTTAKNINTADSFKSVIEKNEQEKKKIKETYDFVNNTPELTQDKITKYLKNNPDQLDTFNKFWGHRQDVEYWEQERDKLYSTNLFKSESESQTNKWLQETVKKLPWYQEERTDTVLNSTLNRLQNTFIKNMDLTDTRKKWNFSPIPGDNLSSASFTQLQDIQQRLESADDRVKIAKNNDVFKDSISFFDKGIEKIKEMQASLDESEEKNNLSLQDAINSVNTNFIRTASTLQELDNEVAYGNSLFDEGWLKTGDYSQALISMASNYENAADEVAKFNLALSQNDEELLNAAENSLRLSIRVGELAEQYELTAEDVEMQARLIQTQYQDQGQDISGEAAAEIAGRNQRLNRGVKTLSENFESWNEVLQTADSLSTEYAEALNNTYEALADLTGAIDAAHIPLDFLNKQAKSGASRLDLMAKAAEGDQEAIRELNYELARTTFENLDYSEDVLELTDDNDSIVTNIIGDPVVFEETKNRILQTIDDLYSTASGYDIGQNLTDEGWAKQFIQDLNEMAAATGMTVEEMNSYLSQIGVDIPVETTYIEQTRELPEYVTHHRYTAGKLGEGEKGIAIDDYSWTETSGKINTAKERIPVAKIGKNAKITYTGGGSVGGISTSSTSGGSSGSSSSTPKRESTKNTSDETERYHVINKETDQLTKAYDRLNTAKDRVFGANRLKLMDAEIANTKKQIALNKEYINQAKSYAQQDYNNLLNGKQNAYTIDGQWYQSEGLRGLGIELQLDKNGVIQNYDEIMAAATARYNERIAAYNTNPENSNLKEIADAEFNSIKELISQYEESNELVQDKLDNNQKLIDQLQDQNLEKFNYKLELKLKISEREKKRIEFELREIGDDAFKSAEALSKMFSTDGSPSQWSVALNDLKTYEKSLDKLNELYAKNEISEEGYVEGLEKVSDGIYEQLETVLDLKDTMEDYYKNTLSKFKEKYDELRTAMSHTTEVLEHLKTVLSLSGRGQDFAATGALLEAEAKAQANAYDVSKANYEKDVRLFKQREKELAEARKNGGEEQIKIAEKQYKEARDAMNASELAMYEDLEKWMQAQQAIIENTIASTADQYAKLMTDGMGFDYLNQVMSLSEKTQDRYLTKTNQLYETEKMRRKLQQDMDKTTNAAAKQRLAQFDKEIQAMQEKNELSKTELSLAQGRYELLLAQIALEEAQNAKTTVRLQRDAEGNYGYVYTADQNAIAEAEQNAADAENNLYNTAREAQNELVKEMFSTQQEYSQAIADLWNNQELSTEEKQQRETELRAQYNDQMSKLAEELGIADIALATWSATGVNDTWTATYTELAKRQTEFNADSEALWDELRIYLVGEDGEGGAFKIISDAANNVLGVSLMDLKTKTNNLTAENKKLKEELIGADGKGGLVKATEDEANAVAKSTIEFGKAYDKADEYFEKLKEINKQIDKLIENATKKITQEVEVNTLNNYHTVYTEEGQRPPESSGGDGDGTNPGNPSPATEDKGFRLYYKTLADYISNTKEKSQDFSSKNEAKLAINKKIQEAETTKSIDDQIVLYKIQDLNTNLFVSKWGLPDEVIKELIRDTTTKANKEARSSIANQNYSWLTGGTGFDTGGYTGRWYHSSDDPMMSGKLAMLHEKELVLNQEDTKNFLASIEMVRDLARIIDLQAASVGLRQQLEARLGFDTAQDELAQNIVIHADFPNATDHNEIMEAFETLADRAAQYANRADRTLAQAQETYNKAKLAL